MGSSSSVKSKKKKLFQSIYNGHLLRDVRKIKQIEDGRILVLYYELFEIIDIKTQKRICKIKPKVENRGSKNMFIGFIGLKNKDLILWSTSQIFYYNKVENNYILSQVINEKTQQINEQELCQIGYVDIYKLYNIIELDNNTLLSCNSLGIKLYNYTNKEYKLIKVIPMFLNVENLIHIKDNNYLVIHHDSYFSGDFCPTTYEKFALSLFDLNSNQIIDTIIDVQTEERSYGTTNYTNYRFNCFLIEDNCIYQVCAFPFIIEDYGDEEKFKNKKGTLSLYFNLYNIKTRKNVENIKTSFCLISHFKDNLVFAQDYETLKICCFEKNKFISIYNFNLNNSNLCLLKNNDLIVYGGKLREYFLYEYISK